MKKSNYSDSQIIAILNQAEAGTPVPELCREHGMTSATFYKWRAKYGGMDASLMTSLKEIEEENRPLKKMYAEERLKAEIADWLIRLTHNQKNWGFGLCYLFLRKVKGYHWNHKRVYQIYKELELNQRIKPKKRIVREKP